MTSIYARALPGDASVTDPRQAALDMLLSRAATMGDQGASTDTIRWLLDRVPMDRAKTMTDAWAAYNTVGKGATDAYNAAIASLDSGSGGGGGMTNRPTSTSQVVAPVTITAPQPPVSLQAAQSTGRQVVNAVQSGRRPRNSGGSPQRAYYS